VFRTFIAREPCAVFLMRSRRTHALSLTRGAAIGASAGFASSKKSLDANKELKTPLYSHQEPFYALSDPIGRAGA